MRPAPLLLSVSALVFAMHAVSCGSDGGSSGATGGDTASTAGSGVMPDSNPSGAAGSGGPSGSGGEANSGTGGGDGSAQPCGDAADITIDNTFGVNEGEASATGTVSFKTTVPANTTVALHLWEWTDQGAGGAQLQETTLAEPRDSIAFVITHTVGGPHRLGFGVDRDGDGNTADDGERGWYPGGASSPADGETISLEEGSCLNGLDFRIP